MLHRGGKQIGALGFCAFSVPAILFLPQTGWESVLLVMAGAILVGTLGRAVKGRALMLLSLPVLLWNVLIMGWLGRQIGPLYGTASPLPGLLLILLAAYSTSKRTSAVVGAVLSFFLIGIYGVLFLFAMPNVELSRLLPAKENDVGNLSYGFLPLLLLYMYREEGKKQRLLWITSGAILALGASLITEGMGAPDFYTASKTVNLFGTMERLEPFVAAAVTVGGFCILSLLIGVNESVWIGLWGEKKKYPSEIFILASMLLCIVATGISDRIWSLGTTICWGLIPIITQLVACKKKE